MARKAEREITNPFVKELMLLCECKSLTELEKKTGITLQTLRGWAFNRCSPESTLEIVAGLETATGSSANQLLTKLKEKQTTT